jgi:hypothetical protein
MASLIRDNKVGEETFAINLSFSLKDTVTYMLPFHIAHLKFLNVPSLFFEIYKNL